jgi:hypothetical protein
MGQAAVDLTAPNGKRLLPPLSGLLRALIEASVGSEAALWGISAPGPSARGKLTNIDGGVSGRPGE